MNKKMIIGILILIVILAVSIIIGFSSKTKVASNGINNCSSIENEYDRYLCYQDSAVEQKDQKICENIVENPYWKDSCFAFVAPAKGDWKICDNVQDKEYKQACLSDVISATNNTKLCEKLEQFNRDHNPVCLPCWPNCPPLD